ncbi:MAG: hypothetical protein ACSHX8_13525 [Opitutaceae bacterium]
MQFTGNKLVSEETKGFRFLSPVLRGALLAGILIHLAGFLLFKVVSNPLPTRDESEAFVRYVSAGSLAEDESLEEQAQLYDSAPLFIPTEWNAAQTVLLVTGKRVRTRFPEFEPKIDMHGALHSSSLPIRVVDAVEQPADLLKSRYWNFFESFGQSEVNPVVFADSPRVAEVFVTGSLAVPTSLECNLEFVDTAPVSQPAHLYIRVSGGGQSLGQPLIAQSSGNPVFDQAAVDWLGLPETIGQLSAGYLFIKVYP